MTPRNLWTWGLEADRPSPGVRSRVYFATDTSRWFLDLVTEWIEGAVGPQGPPGTAAGVPITGFQSLEGTLDASLTQAGDTYEAYMPGILEASLTCNVTIAGAGELRTQYSIDNGSTWNYLSATGTGPSISTSTTGLKDSGWIEIASGAKTSVRIRLVTINGTGATVSLDEAVVRVRGGGTVSTTNHNLLTNRSVADQHPASAITNTPAGQIVSTDLQGAVNELDGMLRLSRTEVSVTGATTLTSTAFGKMHVCSGTTADYTVVLPAASGNAGKIIAFRMAEALTKLVTIDGNAAETINGTTTRIMWARESAILLCDGTGWVKVSGLSRPMYSKMYRNAALTIANATVTTIPLDAISENPIGMADTTGGTVVIKRTSRYQIIGKVYGSGITANATRFIITTTSNAGAQDEKSALSGGLPSGFVPSEGDLTAADTVGLSTYQNSGASMGILTGAANTFLIVREVPGW